jgi:hypothetical protein
MSYSDVLQEERELLKSYTERFKKAMFAETTPIADAIDGASKFMKFYTSSLADVDQRSHANTMEQKHLREELNSINHEFANFVKPVKVPKANRARTFSFIFQPDIIFKPAPSPGIEPYFPPTDKEIVV